MTCVEIDVFLDDRRDKAIAVIIAFVVRYWEVKVAIFAQSLDQKGPLQEVCKFIFRGDIDKARW